MRIKHFLLSFLLLFAVEASAQRLSFDSKYIKVGVIDNGVYDMTVFQADPNIRYLGSVNAPFKENIDGSRASMEAAARTLTEAGAGKQVLDLLLQRDAEGLHFDRLYAEALTNTTVEEVNEAKLDISAETKDVLKKEISRQLLKNNFIVLFSYKEKSDGKKKYYWNVFKVEIDDKIIEQAFLTWNDMERYDQIKVPVKYVARGKVDDNLALEISKKVPEFAVRGPVYSRHPFFARVGAGQGVKSGDLLYIYRSYLDDDNTMYSRKVCTVRATDVYADSTRLYTISGKFASRKRGDIAVYKGAHRWSLAVMGQASFGDDPRYGARMLWEYRAGRFSKNGFTSYVLVGFDFNTFKKDPEGVWWDTNGNPKQPMLMGGAFNLGYGLGFNFLGRLELMPYFLVGLQYATLTNLDLQYYDKEQGGWTTLNDNGEAYNGTLFASGHAGLRLNVNLWYPVQLTLGADYNYNLPLDKKFEAAYDNHELNRVNFYAGLRFNL